MKLSAWNQYWEHKENVSFPAEKIYQELLKHYKQSSSSFALDKENFPQSFSFHRGNVLVSALGLGSELWFKHYIDVFFEETEEEGMQVLWKINLKLFGFQIGTNAIIKECKEAVTSVV